MGKKPIVRMRDTVLKDGLLIEKWLMQPGTLEGFPMIDKREIDDAVRVWMQYVGKGTALTVLYKKEPCGAGNLYIQPAEEVEAPVSVCCDYRPEVLQAGDWDFVNTRARAARQGAL